MAYDRDAAVTYARLFAQVPCSDGFIMLDDRKTGGLTSIKTPDGTRMVRDLDAGGSPIDFEHVEQADGTPFTLPDGTALTMDQEDDCTHFVSCCIGQPPKIAAGGLKLPRMWGDPPNDPYGVSRVSSLMTFLTNHGLVRALATKSDDDSFVDQLAPGDIIAYFNVSAGIHTHLGLFVGGGRTDGAICAHTLSRLAEPWDLGRGGGFLWTFLHFV